MNKKWNTESFSIKAQLIHNKKYNYSLVNYKNCDSKVKIICPDHGIFEQTPYYHLKGHGCKRCGQYTEKAKAGRTKTSQKLIGRQGYWKNKKRLNYNGINHPMWKGGRTKLVQRIRPSMEYRIWRKKIFERDNYTCQICNKRGYKLNADHITPLSKLLNTHQITTMEHAINCSYLWDINNGRTLCVNCHKTTPTYGINAKYYN